MKKSAAVFETFLTITIRFLILIIISSTFFISCETPEYITQVDLNKYDSEFKPGMTQDDINAVGQKKRDEVEISSIGRKIPKVIIRRLDGTQTELAKAINKQTLIALTSAHCSWGRIGVEEDLPKAKKKLEEKNIDLPIICLVIKDSTDYKDSTKFNNFLHRMDLIYPETYIIDRQESNKLNVYADPTRLFINKNKILEQIGMGVSSVDRLFNELERYCTKKSDGTIVKKK